MGYFTDVLATFLDLDSVRILAVYGRVRELTRRIKNILICFPKINGGLNDLEWHEDDINVINDIIFIFVWTIPLTKQDETYIRGVVMS